MIKKVIISFYSRIMLQVIASAPDTFGMNTSIGENFKCTPAKLQSAKAS